MATASPSSGLASSSLPSSTQPSLDARLERLIELKKLAKAIDAEIQSISDDLDQLVEAGEAEEQMVWNDCKITRRSCKSYSYPPHILEQREQLKASERLSLALGEATVKLTTYWTISEAR
jgi:hypothetical protein